MIKKELLVHYNKLVSVKYVTTFLLLHFFYCLGFSMCGKIPMILYLYTTSNIDRHIKL